MGQDDWKRFDPTAALWPDWLIDGIIPKRSTISLFAPPNVGKSFLALDMAMSICLGVDFLDIPVQGGGRVAYLPAEGVSGLPRRIMAWLKSRGIDYTDGMNRLTDLFRQVERPLVIDDAGSVADFVADAKSNFPEPDLLILDPLAGFMKGDENSTTAMQSVVFGLRHISHELGCSVLVLHHSAKENPLNERGSGAFAAGLDTRLHLHARWNRGGDYISLQVHKQRDAGRIDAIRLDSDIVLDDKGRDLGMVFRRRAVYANLDDTTPIGDTGESSLQASGNRRHPALSSRRALIMQAIADKADADGFASFDDIKAALGGSMSDSTLNDNLMKLVAKSLLSQPEERVRRYRLVSRRSS